MLALSNNFRGQTQRPKSLAIHLALVVVSVVFLGCSRTGVSNQLLAEPITNTDLPSIQQASPITLPNPSELAKSVLYVDLDRVKDGSQFESQAPFTIANLEAAAALGVFTPEWTGAPGMSLPDMAYGIYSFALPSYDQTGTVFTTWAEGFAPREGQASFIGLANFDSDNWRWFSAQQDGTLPIADFSPYLSPTGIALVVVAVMGTDECKLARLRIGGNILPLVDLQADTTYGAPPLVVNFDASASLDIDGQIELYSWDFDGDGTADLSGENETQPQHTFSESGDYQLKLIVTDEEGGSTESDISINVNLAPTASLSADPLTGSAPLTVSFDAGSSSDPEEQITDIQWDFDGDGIFNEAGSEQTSNGQATPDYTYSARGLFSPAVKVIDHHNEEDIASVEVSVNAAPNAILSAAPLYGQVPIVVSFDASSSTDPDGTIDDFEWDFDGNGTFNEVGAEADARGNQTPTFNFTVQGGYNSTLRVTDNDGGQSTAAKLIELGGPWEHTWGLSGAESFYGVAADSDGFVFAAGDVENSGEGVLLAKFGPSGSLVWAKTWKPQSSSKPCYGRGVAVDSTGNVYVTGHIVSRIDGKDDDLLLLKFDNDGNLVWDRSWGGGYFYYEEYNPLLEIQEIKRSEYGVDLETDASGNVYVTGSAFYGDWYWINTAFPPYYFESVIEITSLILLKFDPDGNLVFQQDYYIGDYSRGEGIALDTANGLAYCAGVGLWGGQEDALVAAWDLTGAFEQAYNWGGSNPDHAWGVCVGPSGKVVVSGETQSFGEGGFDAFVFQADPFSTPDPVVYWQRSWGGSSTDAAVGVCWDSATNEFVVGGLTNSVGNGSYDMFSIAYSTTGTLGNQLAWGTTGDELVYKIDYSDTYDRPLAAGSAQRTTGASWTGVAGTSSSTGGAWSRRTGENLGVAYDTASLNGSETALGGMLDTGAGGDDALVMQFSP